VFFCKKPFFGEKQIRIEQKSYSNEKDRQSFSKYWKQYPGGL